MPPDHSGRQLRLPVEEPDLDACLAIAYYLAGPPRTGEGARADWNAKMTMLMTDYSRRSEGVAPEFRALLNQAVIRSYGPGRDGFTMSDLTDHVQARHPVDVAVVTVLPAELRATLDVFGVPWKPHHDQPFFRTSVPCHGRPDRDLSVVVTATPKPLNVHVGAPVARLRSRWSPAAVFLVGIAGGRAGRARHGDVVVSQRAFYYTPGRVTTTGTAPRPQVAEPHNAYGNGLYSYDPEQTGYFERAAAFLADLPAGRRPEVLAPGFRPVVHHPATVAVGEQVLRDGKLLEQVAGRYDDTIRAVDLESYGFADAVRDLPWAVFRGISDLTDQHQDDRLQYVAAGLAALSLRDFLENYFVPSDVAEL